MSFSREVKEELSGHVGKSRHCQIAELAALIAFEGREEPAEQLMGQMAEPSAEQPTGQPAGQFESGLRREKYGLLVKKLFHGKIPADGGQKIYETVRMWDEKRKEPNITDVVDGLLLQQACCRRAYIRGAFLAGGSISDPTKSYHFEVVCRTRPQAEQLRDVLNTFVTDAKIVERKRHFVVYVKEGEQIVDILNVMEAHVALMNLENVRILKEMRNSVNRKVNCETANIGKTVDAAVRQLDDIEYIRRTAGLESLPDHLRETALRRLEHPEAPLAELGGYLDPPVGKSGVNHRLRSISRIAEALRTER